MVYCYFAGCNSYPRPERLGCDESVKFFPFPQPCVRVKERDLDWDESLLNNHVQNCDECRLCWNWVLKCRRNDVKIDCVRSVNSNTQICSKHFDNISSKIDYEKCLPLSPVPQVKIEPEDEMAEAAKAESDGMNLEHDLVIIKTEKNDFDDNQEVEDVDDPILHGPANSGVLPGSEYNDVKLEPSSSELARIGNRQEHGTEDGDCDNELTSDFLPVSAEIGERTVSAIGYSDKDVTASPVQPWGFTCSECSYTFVKKKQLNQHLKRKHSGALLLCTECNYSAMRRDLLNLHMKRHNGEILQCPECTYSTSRKDSFLIHLKKHTGESTFQCPECSYATVRKEHLKVHMRMHAADMKFECPHCEYKCTRNDNMTRHMVKHSGTKNFCCAECDYVASRKEHLVRHMLRHVGRTTFHCSQCDFTATRKDNLKRHSLKHSE